MICFPPCLPVGLSSECDRYKTDPLFKSYADSYGYSPKDNIFVDLDVVRPEGALSQLYRINTKEESDEPKLPSVFVVYGGVSCVTRLVQYLFWWGIYDRESTYELVLVDEEAKQFFKGIEKIPILEVEVPHFQERFFAFSIGIGWTAILTKEKLNGDFFKDIKGMLMDRGEPDLLFTVDGRVQPKSSFAVLSTHPSAFSYFNMEETVEGEQNDDDVIDGGRFSAEKFLRMVSDQLEERRKKREQSSEKETPPKTDARQITQANIWYGENFSSIFTRLQIAPHLLAILRMFADASGKDTSKLHPFEFASFSMVDQLNVDGIKIDFDEEDGPSTVSVRRGAYFLIK